MKNELIDLNNHLFAQLERLSEENISNDDLEREVTRSKALLNVASGIVDIGRLAVDAQKVFSETSTTGEAPSFLQLKNKSPQLQAVPNK